MDSNTPFRLQPNENIVEDAPVMQYFGVAMINVALAGGGIGDSGFGGGIVTSKQHKREKSIFDAKNCHVYLTNKRLVFVNAVFNIRATEEKRLEGIFSDIDLSTIEGLTPSTKFKLHSTIDLSVRSASGEFDKISFSFLDQGGKNPKAFGSKRRFQERDEFLQLIQETINNDTSESELQQMNRPEISNEDPLTVLKVRFAKGEISKEEFEEISKLL